MADKIDQLKIGATSYDIDLPPDATPSIASLTVSGAISEGGTSLVNKYLGKSAKAADSDKLDGNDSTYYQKALPTTTTAGKVLKSTTTAGTVEWANDTNTNQTIKVGTTTFGANDVVELTAGSNITLTPNATNKTIEIKSSYTDTGATSIETSGNGNVVSSASYDSSTRKITLTKGVTALTSHQSIKTLKTDNTTTQTASSGEALNGSGTINLHKIAKTGTYGDLIGTPIPGDSGEIKTKYRCSVKDYTRADGRAWYYKLCTLPKSNSGNYASVIISGRIGGWTASNLSSIYCLGWNRDSCGFALLDLGGAGTMASIFARGDLVMYTNADGTVTVYVKATGYFTFDLNVELYQSTAVLDFDGTYVISPSGTLETSASTSTSRVQLEKGVLKVNGTAVTTSSKTAVSGGTDLSLVTTGEKYTWNNKQDKIAATGSTTKPVYFSSNGVASECSTYAGGTAVTLNGTSKAASTASFYAPTSVGTNGQLLSSNGSSLVWTNDNRGLLHHDLGVIIENTTTDKGWGMFNSTYNGFLLKSVRFNANSPSWGVGDFGSGIVFGGVDTKGVMSVAYRTPDIKIAGGNGSGPVWWIGLTGTSEITYDLDRLKYTPTTGGTNGYSLKSNGGSNEPRWANTAKVQLSGSLSAGVHNNTSITLVITSPSYPLTKGVWRYSGTYGTFLIFAPTAITTQGSPRTAYICGYSTPISNNASFELVEV